MTRGLAAAVVTRGLSLDGGGEEAERGLDVDPELATLGDQLGLHPWTGPAVADLDGIVPVARVAGPAFADHVRPRGALLRTLADGQWRYDVVPLPRPFERARAARPIPAKERASADAGRGYGLPPGEEPLRWLAGPEEAAMRPFRDVGDDTASGLAGLSRVVGLPAYGSKSETGEDGMAPGVVWIAQTRAPIYLGLGLDGVTAPPIPWLTPGAPRPRVPADVALADLFAALGFPVDHGHIRGAQPILPESATLASVGDRAGISLGRIGRLEVPLAPFNAFDGRNPRFGRPAQGGMGSIRTERTPRPGMLPKNRGVLESDRRPCASSVLPLAPLKALAGPADSVAGEANTGKDAKLGAWSVTWVAAPEWNGMVTDSWDGTLRLHAEIDVARGEGTVPPTDAVEALFRLLFPAADDKNLTKLRARASLVLGDVVIPFLRMHVLSVVGFQAAEGGAVDRGVVTVVLDARPDDPSLQAGAALGAIAKALSGAVLPPAEVRLVVHPDSSREKIKDFQAPKVYTLATGDEVLAEGDARAPVTLRMSLSPVLRSRGTLPLAPTSILFIDPAYDAGLSSTPVEDRAPLTATTPALPATRGALHAVLYGDRGRVNRRASVTFMMDLAFERKLDDRVQEKHSELNGDFLKKTEGAFELAVRLISKRTGVERELSVAKTKEVRLGQVYELSLQGLVEADGSPAVLEAGDVLVLQVAEPASGTVKVEVAVMREGQTALELQKVEELDAEPVAHTLRIILTDEPVIEPPPALYAALVRRTAASPQGGETASLSLPLHAQSPLPWRADLRDARADFRRGLLRRAATFVWTLARPAAEREATGVHVVKADRNGQTYLPSGEAEFLKARLLAS